MAGLAAVVIRPPMIMKYLGSMEAMVYLGLALNIGCIAILLLLVFHPWLVRHCAAVSAAQGAD